MARRARSGRRTGVAAHADGDRQAVGRDHRAERAAVRRRRDRCRGRGGAPPAVRNRAVGQRPQQLAQLGAVPAVTSKDDEAAGRRRGVMIPAWCAPWKGTAGRRAAGIGDGVALQRPVRLQRIAAPGRAAVRARPRLSGPGAPTRPPAEPRPRSGARNWRRSRRHVPPADLEQIGDRRERLQHGADGGVDSLARLGAAARRLPPTRRRRGWPEAARSTPPAGGEPCPPARGARGSSAGASSVSISRVAATSAIDRRQRRCRSRTRRCRSASRAGRPRGSRGRAASSVERPTGFMGRSAAQLACGPAEPTRRLRGCRAVQRPPRARSWLRPEVELDLVKAGERRVGRAAAPTLRPCRRSGVRCPQTPRRHRRPGRSAARSGARPATRTERRRRRRSAGGR